jgi:hypothetical protein
MALEAELRELMPHVVTVEKRLDQNTDNEPLYGPAVEVQARVESKVRKVVVSTGEERVSMTTTYLADPQGIGPLDRITLPVGFTPRQPRILSVERMPDDVGDYYEAVIS